VTPHPTVYAIRPAGKSDELTLDQVWQQDGTTPLQSGYRHLMAVQAGGSSVLVAVDSATNMATAFRTNEAGRGFVSVAAALSIGGPWDIIEPFLMGNRPHLLTYAARSGQFRFYPLDDDLRSGPPYQFQRNHAPGATAGFTVAHPIVVGGLVFFLCYGFDNGRVLIYSLSATANSPAEVAPLSSLTVSEHQWATRWTRFAFFDLGGGPYFLKTNVGRLNVNIDKVRDNPADGTTEVGTNLNLADALQLDIVRTVYPKGSEPYFLTYIKNGSVTLNRIHSDCKGWTAEAGATCVADATQIVPWRVGQDCYVLFY